MFGFNFSFSNMLYPCDKFINGVTDVLMIKKSCFDVDELTKIMQEKEECDILDCNVDTEKINKSFKLTDYIVKEIFIKKLNLIFKRNYCVEGSEINIFNINIDIIKNRNFKEIILEEERKEKEEETVGGFVNNLVNFFVKGLRIFIKNIKIRLIDDENENNIIGCFFIDNIKYSPTKDVDEIPNNEKMNYCFLNNNTITLEKLLIKEGYQNDDEVFFNGKEEEKINFITCSRTLLFLNNQIEIDIKHDYKNKKLIFDNKFKKGKENLILESILNLNQIKAIIKKVTHKEENKGKFSNKEKKTKEKETPKEIEQYNEVSQKEEKKSGCLNLLGFKFETFQLNIDFEFCYFIILNNISNNDKPKFWVINKKYLNKLNIKEEKSSKNLDNLDLIKKHFSYYEENYLIIFINKLSLNLCKNFLINNNNINQVKTEGIALQIINSNINKKGNEDFSLKEYLTEKNESSDNFVKIYNKLFIDYINKSSFYDIISHDIVKISKLEINGNIISYVNADIKITVLMVFKLKEFFDSFLDKNEEEILEDDLDNKNNTCFCFQGGNLEIIFFLDKNLLKDIQNIDKKKEDYNYNEFIKLSALNIYYRIENIKVQEFSYSQINLLFNKDNQQYLLFSLYEKQTPPVLSILNNNYQINMDKIIFFMNSEIIRQLYDYFEFFKIKDINEDSLINKDLEKIKKSKENKDSIKCSSITIKLMIRQIKIILSENRAIPLTEEIFFALFYKEKNNINQHIDFYNLFNNNIIINLLDIQLSGSYFFNDKKLLNSKLIVRSLNIEDNIVNSKYKIMLSPFNFIEKDIVFLDFDLEINKMQINQSKFEEKFEISTSINLTPITIYLDQCSLYYLINIFSPLIRNKKENPDNDLKKNSIIFLFKKFIIFSFFISFTYNTNGQCLKLSPDVEKKVWSINLISLNDLRLRFNRFELYQPEEKNLEQITTFLYDFYFTDIEKQILTSYIKAIPFLKGLRSIIEGLLDIKNKPIEKYEKRESIREGVVLGVRAFVSNAASSFFSFGEITINYLNLLGCSSNNNNICRNMRYKIKDEDKQKEEYYYK